MPNPLPQTPTGLSPRGRRAHTVDPNPSVEMVDTAGEPSFMSGGEEPKNKRHRFRGRWVLNPLSCVQHKKMLRKPFEQKESNIDRMEHYKSVLSELLSKKDQSFSNRVTKELSSTKAQSKEKCDHVSGRASPLFVEHINGLANNDKKRLKQTLNEIIRFFNADIDEVDRDVQSIVETDEICQARVKELSAALLGKLGNMAQSVEDLLNSAASRCRPMTTEEKIELAKRIRKLPEEALDRVVEIITAGKPESQSSEKITMNLGQLDDATLWRLYYHAECVLKESNV